MSVLLRQLDGGVLLLTFNRPERNNAWMIELEEAYFDALFDAAADPEVRVIVVTGAGKSFCPGLDMDFLRATAAADESLLQMPRRPMTFARQIPKPVLAAINGACAGIGFTQACSSDLRFAARGAKLATSFARRGLPAEDSLSWILPRLIGSGKAMDLLISGRTILAEEAHAMGLVDRLCEPDDLLASTLAYAKDLATYCSPRSMATIKQQLWSDWERGAEDSRQAALALVEHLRGDLKEGTQSYVEKRPPNFPGVSITLKEERTNRVSPVL
jgi:enoyl-CoA hydratase/carnithine racemase